MPFYTVKVEWTKKYDCMEQAIRSHLTSAPSSCNFRIFNRLCHKVEKAKHTTEQFQAIRCQRDLLYCSTELSNIQTERQIVIIERLKSGSVVSRFVHLHTSLGLLCLLCFKSTYVSKSRLLKRKCVQICMFVLLYYAI
ncbi:hypothetical protein HELRODRAFT_169038 [Helobdella robusta]|uniref:Uncharacterized protein n=1 Tax=Helobdella robusta TaxID=6412 RepID=T1F1A6_HELRO|nr:hypothetical protein HELRODRAFT_169038 [Helobdella robusta]ESO09097.1 hypothetical protein HELRODRAFT_169038 [Helobdella robusta]